MRPTSESDLLAELRDRFEAAWPDLVADITADDGLKDLPEVMKWLQIVMSANVLQGKQNRGMACVHFHNQLVQEPTAEEERLAYIFGWCTEIWQAAALIADDMMDSSETRRGQLCWYRIEDVGLNAINDALMLENLVYFLIYKYFGQLPCFSRLLRITHDVGMKTIFGQSLDTIVSTKIDVNSASLEKYKRIVQYKTSYYTFYHPYASAMAIAGITDDNLYAAVEQISMEIGFLFQVQDDYLDCYGSTAITGKVGKDIFYGKCTWLLVTALEAANEEQKATIRKFYGGKMPGDEKEIRTIYKALGMQKRYHKFEDETFRKIVSMARHLPPSIPGTPFVTILHKIYKRNK